MAFCIPKHISKKLLEAAKRGEFDMVQLYNMDSEQRRTFFEGYTTKENAEGINSGFERAMAAKQKNALLKWTEDVFNPKDKKKAQYKDVVDRINQLKEDNLIGEGAEGFYQDLIATRLGVTVTEAELKEITAQAENLEKLYEEKNKFGLPTIEYFQGKQKLQQYLQSIVPASRLKIVTSTIFRGTMLASVKSPLTNIIGNSVQGLVQSMEKRLASGQYKGSNPGLMREYIDYANLVYKKSGYDVTRMITLSDDSKIMGEDIVHTEGEGKVRAAGRVVEDLVFKRLLGAPDVAFSAIAFADTTSLAATKIAQSEGLKGQALKDRSAAIFQDATSIDPKTLDGEAVRSMGIADASYATYTNDSSYSTLALGIRKLFNMATGDLRVGDQIMPFVKTPANVIGGGIDAAGLAAIRATYNLPTAIKELKDGNLEPMKQVRRDFVRSGLGITLAFILAGAFDPDDFIGEYPTTEKERQLLELKNATPNSIRIGDKWVSLDYFGPIGAPLVGMLYAKKYGSGLANANTYLKYAQGVSIQSVKIPGFNQFYDTVKSIKDARPDKSKSVEQNIAGITTSAVDFMRARTIPAIVYDIAKATDTNERKTDKTKPLDKVRASIPGWRQSLPIDKTVIGDERKTENPLSTMLFGARVKTNRSGAVVDELQRLDSTGNLPSITDVEKTSTRVKAFKAQVDEEVYKKVIDEFGTEFGKELLRLTKNPSYQRVDDEKKSALIDKVKDQKLERTLQKYGYRPAKK